MSNFLKKHPLISFFVFFLILFCFFIIYLIRALTGDGSVSLSLGERIEVIEVEGIITDSREIVEQISEARKNKDVKGVVIRINSPGGGVAPSQEIYSEILKLRGEKKVVASLSSLAASGGYYIACATQKIISNPGTLTGSIGVIMDFSNVKGLFEKIGLKNYVIKSGKFKDIGSPVREMTDEEKELLQEVIRNVYRQFISAIVAGRVMEETEVIKYADGRIFSGEQALHYGFVDKLGTLEDSIKEVAQMAGIEGEPKVVYAEKKKSLIEYIIGSSTMTRISETMTMPQLMYLAPL